MKGEPSMGYLTTFIQDEVTGNILDKIDGTIIPAYIGEEVYIEHSCYHVTKVSYSYQSSTGEQGISETIWVKNIDCESQS